MKNILWNSIEKLANTMKYGGGGILHNIIFTE